MKTGMLLKPSGGQRLDKSVFSSSFPSSEFSPQSLECCLELIGERDFPSFCKSWSDFHVARGRGVDEIK